MTCEEALYTAKMLPETSPEKEEFKKLVCEALEKRVVKKVIELEHIKGITISGVCPDHLAIRACPSCCAVIDCRKEYLKMGLAPKACEKCGQALDWSGVE